MTDKSTPENNNKPKEWISVAGLKGRGWTEGNIKSFLGEPDRLADNPHYKSAPKMKLFKLARVEKVEESSSFKEWQSKNATRRANIRLKSLEVMEKRRMQLLNFVDALEIEIPIIEKDELYRQAVESYNDLWSSRGDYEKVASIKSPRGFLDRITVNFLRHECSEYESQIDAMFGKVGNELAYIRLKIRILKAIAVCYPYLEGATRAQISSSE